MLCFGCELNLPTGQIGDFEAEVGLDCLEGSSIKLDRAGNESGKQVSATLHT